MKVTGTRECIKISMKPLEVGNWVRVEQNALSQVRALGEITES